MIRWMMSMVLLSASVVHAAPGERRQFPAQGNVQARLYVQGSTDMELFAAVVADYQRLYPHTEVIYEDVISQEIYRGDSGGAGNPPDLLISAGMDLQTKMVNDGHALTYNSPQTESLPAWAQWRHQVFAIGYEPVAIVYNTRYLVPSQVPRNRRQLLEMLRSASEPLRNKVGTYDAGRSSVGYLLATQDSQAGGMAGALVDALGDNHVRLDEYSSTLLDRVAKGELLLAYNALGSYAQARIDEGAPLGMVMPEDYTLVLLRTAIIPRGALNMEEAQRFLDYLLSARGQQTLVREVRLLPVGGQPDGPRQAGRSFRPIPLRPELLVYLDAHKRRQFLDAWRSSAQKIQP